MEICEALVADRIDACERLALDIDIRQRLYEDSPTLQVPVGTARFWRWLAGYVRPNSIPRIVEREGFPEYPEPDRGEALWFSGGCESTYTLDSLGGAKVDLLSIDDFPVFSGPARAHGQIHFLCAAISAALGYRRAWLGVERHDLLLTRLGGGRYVERSPEFLDAWNAYMGRERLQSLCRDLPKEEVLRRVLDRRLPLTGTCDNNKDGSWCCECFKCYEAYYTAKAIGRDLGFKLKRSAFRRFQHEYSVYLSSGFRNNFNNAQQYFLRLQAMHGTLFSEEEDCSAELVHAERLAADAAVAASLLAIAGLAPGPELRAAPGEPITPSPHAWRATDSLSCDRAVLDSSAAVRAMLAEPALREAVEALFAPDTPLLSRADLVSVEPEAVPQWRRVGSRLTDGARKLRALVSMTCAIPLDGDSAVEWVAAGRRSDRAPEALAETGEVRRIIRGAGASVLIAGGTPVRLSPGRWLLFSFVRAWCKPDILFAAALAPEALAALPRHVRDWCGESLLLPTTVGAFLKVEESAAAGAFANVYGRGI